MHDLEKAINKWRKELYKNEAFEDGYVEELESHLREEIEGLIGSGLDSIDAFEEAVQKIGSTESMGAEFYKTHTERLSGRPPWQTPRFMPALLWNYWKVALRKIRRHKGYSLINIVGLAIGMACCILILTWVRDELSYDRFHKNADRICRIVAVDRSGGNMAKASGSPSLIGPTLVEKYPEFLNFARVQCGWSGYFLHYGEKNFMEMKLATVDPSFFEVFQYPFIQGNPQTALDDRYTIVLTESLAKKIFGDEDPMGRVLKISATDFKVTGVMEDIPRNSHLRFDYVFPAINMTEFRSSKLDSWNYNQFSTYLLVKKNTDFKALSKKISGIVKEHLPKSKVEVFLQPLSDIHLHSTDINSWEVVYPNPGNITYVYIFGLIAVCILLIACINFMNLATARSSTRAREVGMRKVSGARRFDLFKQFIGESIVLSTLSLGVGILIVELLLPAFNHLSGKQLSLQYAESILLWISLLGIAIFTGLASGSYPALILSAFQPSKVLKASAHLASRKGGYLRKTLVVGQFVFTILLIIGTLVIYGQLRFIQNKDLGYDTDNIFTFATYGQFGRNYEAAKNELLQNPNILSVCRAFPPSPGFRGTENVDWEGKDPSTEFMIFSDIGDYDYFETFGIEMAEGRFYSRQFSTDGDNFVVNETAVKKMGLESPIGKRFTYADKTGVIIGIVKDYHGGSLHNPILPKVITLSDRGFFVCVKFRPGNVSEMVAFLKEKWEKFVPGYPFRYGFLDESIAEAYKAERKIGKIFQYFTGLAILIACLGLFGLASFTAEQRTKEVGIRKILGAKVSGIVFLLSKEFTKWILVANIISWPIAYFLSKKWLESFAYRMSLGWEIFVLSAVLTFFIALATVSYQAIKAAIANPVESLRYE
jgi:putative ABC transport system permease protein